MPESSSTSTVRRPVRELLTAWLLLLLNRGPSYGYELRRQLVANSLSIDPGTMYRRLRVLEQERCVASSWTSPVAGPRRRQYRLTAKGRRSLDEAAEQITAFRDTNEAFLRAYTRGRRT